MTPTLHILLAICLAPALALVLLLIPSRARLLREALAVIAATANLGLVATTFGQQSRIELPWLGTGFDLSLRVYHTASFVTTAAAGFGLLVTLYSLPFMRKHRAHGAHYALMLLSLGMANGAVFSNNLLLLLFSGKACWGRLTE